MIDRVKQAVMLESDRPHVLREMMYVCRPAGVLSVAGVYGGMVDKIPFGAAMNKGLTIRTGQTHVKRWTDDLLQRIERRPDRPVVRHHPHRAARGRAGHVQDLPRQGRRLRQGRHEALRAPPCPAAPQRTRSSPWTIPAPSTRSPASCRRGPRARCDHRHARSAGSASPSAWPSWRCREPSVVPPARRTCLR